MQVLFKIVGKRTPGLIAQKLPRPQTVQICHFTTFANGTSATARCSP